MVRKIDYGYLQSPSNSVKKKYYVKKKNNGSKIIEVVKKITVLDNTPSKNKDIIQSKEKLKNKGSKLKEKDSKEKSKSLNTLLDRIKKLR